MLAAAKVQVAAAAWASQEHHSCGTRGTCKQPCVGPCAGKLQLSGYSRQHLGFELA